LGWLCFLPAVSLADVPCSWLSLTSWGLHCIFHLTLTASCKPCHTLRRLKVLHLISVWKPPWHHNSCIQCAFKSSITWIFPRSAASSSSNQAFLDYGCSSLCLPIWLNIGNHFLDSPL
jgi:hypothetical protein